MANNNSKESLLQKDIKAISRYIKKNGPEPNEYGTLLDEIKSIAGRFKDKTYGQDEIKLLSAAFGDSLSLETLQGHIFHKPHGYNGDYEVMEKVYLEQISPNPKLARWDSFWQCQNGSRAVRNRKQYFKDLLKEKIDQKKGTLHVLNIASGSCRDLYEFIRENPKVNIKIDCVDIDQSSILYAKSLIANHIDKFRFFNVSSFKFEADKKYDLIWSGGLFDYFSDKNFVISVRRWIDWLNETGEIGLGNFTNKNSMKDFMYILDWKLYYRNKFQLLYLSRKIIQDMKIEPRVGSEPEEVNLFLHLKKIPANGI